ncbi:hypothetical protein WT56_34385 [Burkholderia pseudomultivorans]|uniref:Lipoprotein n=2 Tax=Burkholderia pseudomultivorans TaxID=1207504 RepID=A0A132EMP8_9BURK|nr:hypothetical protein WT56_34385 [Burkholderia pseudomultivorans]
MNFHPLKLLAAATVTVMAFSACTGQAHDHGPKTVFNQKLTDDTKQISALPPDVEQVQCWAQINLIYSDQVACNATLRGRAVKDMGAQVIGWAISVRESSRFDGLDGSEPRYLLPSQFDLRLLASTGFMFAAKNGPQGTAIEVAADQSVVTFNQAKEFLVAVLPVVSGEIGKQIETARAQAQDSIQETWANTATTK